MSCDCQVILQIRDLSFSYDGVNPTLENVNLIIRRGESASIIGPNGGGKSTLLKLILGLLLPQKGSIELFGRPPAESRELIGYMPQYHQLDAAFPISAFEVVLQGTLHRFFWGRYPAEARLTALEAMRELGIEELQHRLFPSLSGGQRQRVLIARALACRPRLLLLDEPTANIDPGAEEEFYGTLTELRRKMSIMTVSHDLGFVRAETDHVICVNRQLTVHDAGNFDQEKANRIYRHDMHLVHHDHSCFCNCAAEESDEVKK